MQLTASCIAILAVCCACAGQALAGSSNTRNDYTFGTCPADAVLLQRTPVTTKFRFGRIQTEDFSYSFTPSATAAELDCIRIRDLKPNRGATAVLTSANTFPLTAAGTVTITFTSQRGAGIKSVVEIYGSP